MNTQEARSVEEILSDMPVSMLSSYLFPPTQIGLW
jgi:hypothetical protein